MSKVNNKYIQGLPLFALKGTITIQFVDGKSLRGEFVTQDRFNIFVRVNDEPLMIPRTQIRYVKGQTGQPIAQDDSVAGFAQDSARRPAETTEEAIPTLAPTAPAEEDEDVTVLLTSDDDDDATMLLEADDDDVTVFIAEEEEDDDSTVFIEDEDEDTMSVGDDATLVDQPIVAAYLECTTGPHSGETFDLQSGVTTLGRSSDNVITLSKDKEISRRHALITNKEDQFVVEDRGSLNGVMINDVRIDGPVQINDGDTLLIGISALVFHEQ